MVRAYCAKLLGIDLSNIRVIPAEIGGGFGGKTLVYLEPLALALSKKSGRPVKMVMTREEVFRATGPTSGADGRGEDRRQEGRHHHRRAGGAEVSGRRLPGLAGAAGLHGGFAMYDIQNVDVTGYDVVSATAEGRGLSRARRADLVLRRRKRDRRARPQARHGPDRAAPEERGQGRHQDRLRADLREHRLRRDAGGGEEAPALRRRRSGRTRAAAWPPASGSTSAAKSCGAVHIAEDGTAVVMSGNPDIGGSRASHGDDGGRGAGHPDGASAGRSSPTPPRSASPISPAAAA